MRMPSPRRATRVALLALLAVLAAAPVRSPSASAEGRERVAIPESRVRADDGDTIVIHWPRGPEVVRLLGIDAPEVFHPDHDIPFAQPFGREAAAFLDGCLAVADRIELPRSGDEDPFGRTLGYLFLNGKNYSVLALRARLAVESVSRYGDNGLPSEARACVVAAKAAGPVPFEEPHRYRARMRKVAAAMKARGTYPCQDTGK